MKKPITIIFICLVAAQLFVPANMIIGREITLKTGKTYKFKTAPVDPYDPFRGRYVALRFEQRGAPVLNNEKIKSGQWVYVILETDKDGFVKLGGASMQKPDTDDYLRARVTSKDNSRAVQLDLTFNRYYMDEHMAPEAERVYRNQNRRGDERAAAYVTVRIRSGSPVLEELYIEDTPVNEYVKEMLKNK